MQREQIEAWQGDFGTTYTDRNQVDWTTRVAALRSMFADLDMTSALEIGCNKGHNLVALRHILPGLSVHGVEPNPHALALARQALGADAIVAGSALDLPFADGAMDLCFTAGVLIHIPPDALERCLKEICRVSRRYVFCAEYHADEDTEIVYRGRSNLLWKRDYLGRYLAACPGLVLARQDFWGPEQGFDNVTCWLMEKRS